VGKTIGDLSLDKDNVIVAAVVSIDGTRRIHPAADTLLNEGDEIVIVGASGCIHDTVRRLSGKAA
jgi:Trk K+ transport system NAD-binding subunit